MSDKGDDEQQVQETQEEQLEQTEQEADVDAEQTPPTPIDPEAPPAEPTEEDQEAPETGEQQEAQEPSEDNAVDAAEETAAVEETQEVTAEQTSDADETTQEEPSVVEGEGDALKEHAEDDAAQEETQPDEAPAEDVAAQEETAEETGRDEAPTEEATPQEVVEDDATQEVPAEEPSQDDAPTEEATQEEAATEEATQEEAAQEEATQEEAATEEATQEEAATEEAAQEEAATEEATQEAPAEEGAAEDAPQEVEEPATEEGTAPEDAPAEDTAAPEDAREEVAQDTTEKDAEAPEEAEQTEVPQTAEEETQPTTVDASTERTDQVPEVDPQGVTPRSQFPPDATATVKFMLMPSGQMVTLAYTLAQTILQCKEHFATELKMPAESLIILLDGKAQEDQVSLGELGVQPNGTIQLEVQSSDPTNLPMGEYRPRDDYHMPDVISVRVQLENGDYKDVVVEISRPMRKKPFQGGYRHKKTGVEYHHASAQTVAKPPPPPLGERNCRETQTTEQRQQLQQTTNNMSTQMTGIGIYVSNMTDKLVVPGRYVTADERTNMVVKKVVTLQKYFRRWYARRYVKQVREDRDRRLEWERQEEERKKQEKEERIKKEFERRMNPKTKEDFDLLYHALEKWRLEEVEVIDSTLSGAERKAALCQLLEQETQLIASIGRNKLEADQTNSQKRVQKFLGKAAAPKRWKGRDGKYTEMDTPYTIRARELMDIYNSVTMKYLTQDERLDVLLTLKHTVKEHDCKLTQEIIELIDREADLLMRGVKEQNLEGLRKRIATLFLQYIKTPTFNPEITKYLKVPQDPAALRKNIYFCSSCNHYLPSTEFQLASNERTMGKCRRCNKVDNDARVRQDYSYYRQMLANLRKAEEQFHDNSKIAFLMQEGDLRYLVENVWNSQSMLSAWDDLYDLELVRWDVRDEWSPWNTILLTKEEAAAHAKLENLEEGYGRVFIHKAQHKHTLARNYFSRLPGMAELMRQKDNEQENRMPSVSGKRVSVQASA